MPPSPNPQQKEPAGPIVGTIIIVALMAIGAIYFFLNTVHTRARSLPTQAATTSTTSVP